MKVTEPGNTVPTPEAHWTNRRLRIREWLLEQHETLGQIYAAAVELLFKISLPGYQIFVAHAVRDIANMLPKTIVGEMKTRHLRDDHVVPIIDAWQSAGFGLDGTVPSEIMSSQEMAERRDSSVSVPLVLIRAVGTLVSTYNDSFEKRLDQAKRLFEAISVDGPHMPVHLQSHVERWFEVTKWFVKRAHAREKGQDADWDGLVERFELFESALAAFVEDFAATLGDLDGILGRAHAT